MTDKLHKFWCMHKSFYLMMLCVGSLARQMILPSEAWISNLHFQTNFKRTSRCNAKVYKLTLLHFSEAHPTFWTHNVHKGLALHWKTKLWYGTKTCSNRHMVYVVYVLLTILNLRTLKDCSCNRNMRHLMYKIILTMQPDTLVQFTATS